MIEWLKWFTQMENTKPFVLVLFFVTFVLIVLYVYANRNRSKRFESYKNIPFQEDDRDGESKEE